METDKRRRTIHYKLAKTSRTPYTLQELIENVLLIDRQSKFSCAKSRQEKLSEDGKAFRFINNHSKHGGDLLLCQLVQFEEGLTQMTIVLDESSASFELNPFKPEDIKKGAKSTKGKKTEFLDSMLYFGVLGNHVVILGSQALRSKELESHLNWFLMNLTNQLTTMVVLSDKPTKKAVKQIQKQPAKSVVLGSDIEYEQPISEVPKFEEYEETVSEINRLKWTPKTVGAEILNFLKQAGHLDSLKFDDSFDATNFHLTLELSYNRTTTKKGQKALDSVATSLRHMDKEDVKINLKGGGTIKGDDLKLSTSVNVKFINGKIDESDLYLTMVNWLKSKLDTEEINSDLHDVLAVATS